MIDYRHMKLSEIGRIAEIDRTEYVTKAYQQNGSELDLIDVEWDIRHWSVQDQLKEWDKYLQADCVLWGAFDGDLLAGFCGYRPNIAPRMGQFALLYVSAPYRRQGIGRKLAEMLLEYAKEKQVVRLYLTAEHTRGTIEFYRSLGFQPTDKPLPELLKMEPEDIHMIMEIPL